MHLSIAIDVSHYGLQHPTGVEVYVDSLLPQLVQNLRQAGVVVYLLDHRRISPAQTVAGGVHVYLPYKRDWLKRSVKPWVEMSAISLFFTPSGISPIFSKKFEGKSAFTIHDISVYQFLGAYSPTDWYRFFVRQRLASRRAALILTPSHYVKEQIKQRLNCEAVVVPLATGVTHSQQRSQSERKAEVVVVGRIEPKKNLLPIIRAARKQGVFSIVLIGGFGQNGRRYWRRLKRVGKDSVTRLGYVDQSEKINRISQAAALAVPSPYEGFGLPVLEGFACSQVLLVANAGAAAEVAGAAAILVDSPLKMASWAKALAELAVLSSDQRDTLVAEGCERLSKYTWGRTAEETAAALLRVLRTI